ncbi:MAG: carbohydrate kinase family protein [Planctomycetales bacterium]
MTESEKSIDCIICGSCVVDILVRPVPLETSIGGGRLIQVDPIEITTGGIVSNSGIAMSRLGMQAVALSYVGSDQWGNMLRERYRDQGLNADHLVTHPEGPTSTTAVLIDESGERSFAHCVGAPERLDRKFFIERLDLFAKSRMMLLGYYSLMPGLEADLADVFAEIRQRGCLTALDAAGDGGSMEPLCEILPHLDVYVPSHAEASNQTGKTDPREIISVFREHGAIGLLGVKLGSQGALLQTASGSWIEVPAVQAPAPVVDTTGAGDSFYAGLLTGLLRDMNEADAGRLAAACGACCVTGLGATGGLRSYEETARLAGLI